MISSAALPSAPFTHTPNGGGAAEVTPNSTKPRPVQQHRNGASKTALSTNAMKEATIYEQRAYQQRRHRHRPHARHVGKAGQGPARAREGRQEVTAPAIVQPDLAAVERDLATVLIAHGITGITGITGDTVHVAVYPIVQADQTVGVSITGMVYTRPAGVPAPRPAADRLGALAEDLEAVS